MKTGCFWVFLNNQKRILSGVNMRHPNSDPCQVKFWLGKWQWSLPGLLPNIQVALSKAHLPPKLSVWIFVCEMSQEIVRPHLFWLNLKTQFQISAMYSNKNFCKTITQVSPVSSGAAQSPSLNVYSHSRSITWFILYKTVLLVQHHGATT